MSTPPRRRRRPDARSSKSGGDGGGWLPTLAMGLGVVVAGLGIGALVAVFMQRGGRASEPVVVVTSTPAPSYAPQRPPVAIATILPPRTPRPSASPSRMGPPSSAPSASPAPSPVATDSPTLEPSPTAAPAVVAAPVATATAGRVTVQTAAPTPSVMQTSAPTAPPSAPLVATPAPTLPAASAVMPGTAGPPTQSSYDEHASAVVRRYVDALIRGDEKAAYSALGGSGGTLSEQAFLDTSARIVSLKVTRVDASNATVECEIAAAKGHYYATYHVTAATSGPYISAHDYIKV